MARARGEESELNDAFGQKTPPPRAASTVHFDLFDDGDVLAARPPPLVEVRPQLGVQRHTSEQVIETFVLVQVLDAPVPQMGVVQVVEFMQQFDVLVVAEQVIDVPKISLDRTQQRLGDCLRQPQTAEQLVEVLTIISYSSLQRSVEQNIDIPVPQVRGGGGGGLQGFRPGQGSPAADVEQIIEIPVPQRRRRRSGGLQSSLPGQGSTASLEQIPGFPARGGPQGLLPGKGSSRFPGGADEGIQGGFRTFSRPEKSAGWGPHSGSELGADFTPWTPSAYAESMKDAYDVAVEESEAAVVVEEGAETRFAAGFRPMRVCMRFLEHQMGRPVWGCAYGDRCTFAHSWAELHPEASARERQLASYFPD